jgi:hypothetical protein
LNTIHEMLLKPRSEAYEFKIPPCYLPSVTPWLLQTILYPETVYHFHILVPVYCRVVQTYLILYLLITWGVYWSFHLIQRCRTERKSNPGFKSHVPRNKHALRAFHNIQWSRYNRIELLKPKNKSLSFWNIRSSSVPFIYLIRRNKWVPGVETSFIMQRSQDIPFLFAFH